MAQNNKQQASNSNVPTWNIKVLSGLNAGANTILQEKQISFGDTSSFDDDIILDDQIGASRLILKVIGANRISAIINGSSISINEKPIFEGIEAKLTAPLLINFGTSSVEVTLENSENYKSPTGFKLGALELGAISVAALAIIGSVLYLGLKKSGDFNASNLNSIFEKAQSNNDLGKNSLLKQANASNEVSQSSTLMDLKSKLASIGLSGAISLSEENGVITAVGRVTPDEAGAWNDLKLSIKQANGQQIVDRVGIPEDKPEAEIQATRAIAPSLSGSIDAIDYASGQMILSGGRRINVGAEVMNGWRLSSLNDKGISISKDRQDVFVANSELLR